jgi:exopolysaccharide biosynthesis polyprenyl glycosylphosphotransferase
MQPPLERERLPLSASLTEDMFKARVPRLSCVYAPMTPSQRAIKRTLDIVGSLVLIVLTLPVMFTVAILVKLDSVGPMLFTQKRVGENGELFTIYKFRTMVLDAKSRQADVFEPNYEEKLIYKKDFDPRITQVGRVLRRTSLDELPQLFNVLLGNMSLVGPRPELPELVAKYESWQYQRLIVPQGITGWWQINGRSTKPLHLNTDYDLYYIRHYSLLLDLWILLKTPRAVLSQYGAF